MAIAGEAGSFVTAMDATLARSADWQTKVDAFLKAHSWDATWAGMSTLIGDRLQGEIEAPSEILVNGKGNMHV